MKDSEEDTSTNRLHHCKGYIENVQHLSISQETIQRAKRCGFNTSDFAECCLKAINHNTSSTDNGYDDIAKIAENFADAAIPFLKRYQVKDVQVAHFQSNDPQEELALGVGVEGERSYDGSLGPTGVNNSTPLSCNEVDRLAVKLTTRNYTYLSTSKTQVNIKS
jgi:hypothetical protein